LRDDEADDLPDRGFRRPGQDDRVQGNLADGRPIPGGLGRRPTPITVNAQTKISKVNPSLRLGNTTLISIHSDKRAQQGRSIRIIYK